MRARKQTRCRTHRREKLPCRFCELIANGTIGVAPRYAGLAEQCAEAPVANPHIGSEFVPSTTGYAIDPRGIDHPSHYNSHPAGIECVDVIEHFTHNIGAAVKYLWRAGLKPGESTAKDLEKARWYIDREIKRLDSNKISK